MGSEGLGRRLESGGLGLGVGVKYLKTLQGWRVRFGEVGVGGVESGSGWGRGDWGLGLELGRSQGG